MPLLIAITALVALALGAAPASASAKPPAKDVPPNIVVVMTDDQDFRSMGVMPKTRRLIRERGTEFETSIVNFPLCCPSRATYYTGQYAHNHGVLWNNFPQGGYYAFNAERSLPVWLQDAGYRTIHIGKFLNEYGERDPLEVPPGWSDWYGGVDPSTYDYYDYTINHNGQLMQFGSAPEDYSVDVYSDLADDAIEDAKRADEPFFLSLAPNAPHTVAADVNARVEGTPAVPPPRYADRFATASMPRYPNFNEADMSDKPSVLQAFFPNPLTDAEVGALEEHWRGRMGSLLAVDDLTADLVRSLKDEGVYRNTVIVYTSDNGWILGEHRLRDPVTSDGKAAGVKYVPYEGSSRVPLFMAGPGIPEDQEVEGVTTNADLAPTIMDLADAGKRPIFDGMSLVKAAKRPKLLRDRAVLIQTDVNPRGVPPYSSIRTRRYRLDRENDGEIGLYDLKRDPWELQSVHDDPRYDEIEAILLEQLLALRECARKSCRVRVPELPQPG